MTLCRTFLKHCLTIILMGGFLIGAGFAIYMMTLPKPPLASDVKADAALVYTGGAGRIEIASALLQTGRARRLFISGVPRGVPVHDILKEAGVTLPARLVACCIELGTQATNTVENALESAEWIQQRQVQSIILVTSTYHLRRAVMELRMAEPRVNIVPFATETQMTRGWWRESWRAKLLFGEYAKTVVTILRYGLWRFGNP